MIPSTRPSWWAGASYTEKAGWLAAAGHAKDFTHACSLLAKMPRSVRKPPAKTPTGLWYQD